MPIGSPIGSMMRGINCILSMRLDPCTIRLSFFQTTICLKTASAR